MCPTGLPPPDPGPALSFAEGWADFTKACAIYPETNARVRAALDAMLAALPEAVRAAASPERRGLEICFPTGAIRVAGETRELVPGTNLMWLHDRIHRAALAGVAFHVGVAAEAVFAFTRHLLEVFARRDVEPTFEALWRETWPGLDLVDRRFAGTFGGGTASRPEDPVPSWGEASATQVDLSQEQPVAAALAANPQVRSALLAIERRLAGLTREGEAVTSVDLLGRISRQMPRDVMHDPEIVVRLALAALQGLEGRLAGGSGRDTRDLTLDASLTQLMFEASQGLLGRGDVEEQLVPEIEDALSRVVIDAESAETDDEGPGTTSRASDAAIVDDAGLFASDLARLPAPFAGRLATTTVESLAEEVAVHLHFLAEAGLASHHDHARRGLVRLLARPSPGEADVLRQYLEPQAGEDEASYRARHDRIRAFLHAARLARTLRECGLLAPERVEATFPNGFGLYLDALEPDRPREMEELAALAGRLGRDAILRVRNELLEREDVLAPARLERLLAAPGGSMLPFLRLVMEAGSDEQRARTLAVLRKLRAGEEGACLLFVVDRPEMLPRPYLIALTDPTPGQDAPRRFREEIAVTLARYVEATAEDEGRTTRRVYAIRHMARFMSSEALTALANVLRRRRWFVFPREPKAVREAAREALRAVRLRD